MNLDKDDILLQHDRRIHVLEKQIQCLLDRSTLSHPTQYSNHHNHHNHHHSQREEESKHEIASPTQQPWSTNVFSLFGNDSNSITDDKSITTSINDGKKTLRYSIDALKKLRPNNIHQQRHNIKIKQKFSHDKKLDKRQSTFYDSKPPVLVPVIDNIKPKSVDIGGGLILESEGDENG